MHGERRTKPLIVLLLVAILCLVVSGWHPYDRATWWMEVMPAIIAMPILWLTYKRFPLSTLLYVCIFIHATVLMVGGAYTYARVPLGFQIQDVFHLSRNPYDKIGHLFQGFVPALVAREIFIRVDFIRGKRMLAFLVVCVVLAIS